MKKTGSRTADFLARAIRNSGKTQAEIAREAGLAKPNAARRSSFETSTAASGFDDSVKGDTNVVAYESRFAAKQPSRPEGAKPPTEWIRRRESQKIRERIRAARAKPAAVRRTPEKSRIRGGSL